MGPAQKLTGRGRYFLQQATKKYERPVKAITREAMAVLYAYDFPGNVRELKNALEHAVIMTSTQEVRAEDLPKSLRTGHVAATPSPSPASKSTTLASLRESWLAPHERRYITELLDASGGKVDAAAKKAGVNRVTFYRLMKKHGVRMGRTVTA